jgi:hypothetical protein
VGLLWEKSDKPKWSFEQTVKKCIRVDKEFERENRNPAAIFRTARLERDTKYIERWVRGCHFEWLST